MRVESSESESIGFAVEEYENSVAADGRCAMLAARSGSGTAPFFPSKRTAISVLTPKGETGQSSFVER